MYEIKEIDEGHRGLFATNPLKEGTVILWLITDSTYLPHPTRTSIQVRDQHLEHYEGGHVNHHCDPNTEIKIHDDFIGRNTSNKMQSSLVALVVAKRDIYIGEEITFDYETTEFELAAPFECNCHGRWIRGKIHRYQE